MKNFTPVVALALAAVGCASAPSHVTAPTAFFAGKSVADVQSIIVTGCGGSGGLITSQTANILTCQHDMTGGAAIMTQLALGNSYSTPPVAVFTYSIVDAQGGVRVTWSEYRQTQMVGGQVNRITVVNESDNSRIRAAMLFNGAT